MVCKSQSGYYLRLLLCGCPDELLKGKYIAIMATDHDQLMAYADESEQADTALSPYLMAAYLLPASLWIDFSNAWHDCCVNRQPKIDFFHAVEAESRTGQFLSMATDLRNAKVRDLGTLIKKHRLLSYHCWVSRQDYNNIVAGRVPSEVDDPYYVLWEHLTGLIAYSGIHHNVIEPVDFIFDEKKHMEQRVINVYHQIVAHAKPPISKLLGNTPMFKSDEKVMPLQAADMLAWNLRRRISYPDEKRPIPELLDMIQPEEIASLHLDQEVLGEFVKQFRTGGKPEIQNPK